MGFKKILYNIKKEGVKEMISIDRRDFLKIRDILERREHCSIKFSGETFLKTRVILNGDITELYMVSQGNDLIIRRINLKNTRKGTGTLIIKELLELCKRKGFTRLVVESTLSGEMILLCKKMNFIKESDDFDIGEFGNYFKNV